MATDSMGNKLPDLRFITKNTDDMGDALTINSFLLAVKVAKDKGALVIYKKDTKTATVVKEGGTSFYLTHN